MTTPQAPKPESQQIFDHIIHAFCDHTRVNSDILLTTMFYLEKWFLKTNVTDTIDKLFILLKEEEIDETSVEIIRNNLIQFASTTQSLELFQQTVSILGLFRDPRLTSLFDGWLHKHVHELLAQNAVVHSLLISLENCGETPYPKNRSSSISDCNTTLADARAYLNHKMGINIPW